MNKVEFVDSFIVKCDNALNAQNKVGDVDLKDLIKEIMGTFYNDIENLIFQLDTYGGSGNGKIIDYLKDVNRLKFKLMNFKADIIRHEESDTRELEKLRLQQSNTNITNQNNSTATNKVDVKTEINTVLVFEQTIGRINDLTEEGIGKQNKEELIEKIEALNGIRETADIHKVKGRAMAVLKFALDKSADAVIAILPYITALFSK